MIRFGKTPDGLPIEFPYPALRSKHVLINGKTGSGKSLLTASLAGQFAQQQDTAVVIIDLSGDQFFFNYMGKLCERIGKHFDFLSLDERDDSSSCEPFQSCAKLGGNVARNTNFIAGCLNLIYPEGYGSGFYSKQNYAVLATAIERIVRNGQRITLATLAKELRRMQKELRRQREPSEATLALEQLLHYPQLNDTDSQKSISIERSIEECGVSYFFLPTLQEPLTSRALGSLILWSVANECVDRTKRCAAIRQVIIVIDEWQQLIGGKAIEDIFVLLRKHYAQLVCSNQTPSQLKLRHVDLRPVVTDNTSIRVHFTLPTEEDRQSVLDHSKTVTALRKSTTAKGLGSSITMQETEQPGFDANLCRDISGEFGAAILIQELGTGHHDPIHMISEPPVSKEEYAELSSTPLPRREKPFEVIHQPVRRSLDLPSDEVREARHAALLAIVEEKRRLRNEWRTQIPPKSN